jgi:hypothetical protein
MKAAEVNIPSDEKDVPKTDATKTDSVTRKRPPDNLAEVLSRRAALASVRKASGSKRLRDIPDSPSDKKSRRPLEDEHIVSLTPPEPASSNDQTKDSKRVDTQRLAKVVSKLEVIEEEPPSLEETTEPADTESRTDAKALLDSVLGIHNKPKDKPATSSDAYCWVHGSKG